MAGRRTDAKEKEGGASLATTRSGDPSREYAQPRVAVPPREQRSEGRNRKRNGALKGAATIRRTEGTIFRLLPGISDIVPLQSEKMAR